MSSRLRSALFKQLTSPGGQLHRLHAVIVARIRATREDIVWTSNQAAKREIEQTTRATAAPGRVPPKKLGTSSLGTIDRIVFPDYEPLIALTAAATVTERMRLVTLCLLGNLRMDAAIESPTGVSLECDRR